MNNSETPPKVFISHASEDKERFVLPFARKLLESGINAWVDDWEMLLGDNLVKKIFDEGIGNAKAGLVVLSKNFDKFWPKKELDVLVVQSINEKIKLIPIILDDVEIPTSVSNLLLVKITDLTDLDSHVTKIKNSIFNRSDKPQLNPSSHPRLEINIWDDLSEVDQQLLTLICEVAFEKNKEYVNFVDIDYKKLDITEKECIDSMTILDDACYLENKSTMRGTIPRTKVLCSALLDYASELMPEYENSRSKVISLVANEIENSNQGIISKLDINPLLADTILEDLKNDGLLKSSSSFGGGARHTVITSVSPRLKRML
jgi:hypothetical protein